MLYKRQAVDLILFFILMERRWRLCV